MVLVAVGTSGTGELENEEVVTVPRKICRRIHRNGAVVPVGHGGSVELLSGYDGLFRALRGLPVPVARAALSTWSGAA